RGDTLEAARGRRAAGADDSGYVRAVAVPIGGPGADEVLAVHNTAGKVRVSGFDAAVHDGDADARPGEAILLGQGRARGGGGQIQLALDGTVGGNVTHARDLGNETDHARGHGEGHRLGEGA